MRYVRPEALKNHGWTGASFDQFQDLALPAPTWLEFPFAKTILLTGWRNSDNARLLEEVLLNSSTQKVDVAALPSKRQTLPISKALRSG